ncbi:MAG: metallophosphoesterase [Clostridiales bacterium]|nr:metallophosphoesterase [Candidatus Coliplasma equi]
MSIFTIADLHLSYTSNKPMDIFGEKWENHTEKLRENWQNTVKDGDTVIIAGDISWGMRTEDALADLSFVESLNGKKIIVKGNHDFWWQTMKKLYEYKEDIGAKSIDFLFNNAYRVENYVVCGTRGWFPEDNYSPEDEKIVNREAERLRTSILKAKELADLEGLELLTFLHYPPAYGSVKCERICEVLHEYGIKKVWYGHLHGAKKDKLVYQTAGADLTLVSADWLDFKPLKIK